MYNFLEAKIISDSKVGTGHVLRVDNFLNHYVDIAILRKIAREFKRRFATCGATKILTLESSGIALAAATAMAFNIPFVFAKKDQSNNMVGEKYMSEAFSYTHQCLNHVYVSKAYLTAEDRILIIDDFLANGETLRALTDLVKQAGAQTVGIGIAIEKGFQDGGRIIREQGYHLESLAIIDGLDDTTGRISIRKQK